jgi:hypothetical protein
VGTWTQGPALQPERRFSKRWMVETGFCQRDFGQTNEQQRHFSELYGEIDSIQTMQFKTTFYPPAVSVVSAFQLRGRQ